MNLMTEEKIKTEIFRYEVTEGVSEYHAILRVADPLLTYKEQVDFLLEAYSRLVRRKRWTQILRKND